MMIISSAGGMDIEDVAEKNPEKIITICFPDLENICIPNNLQALVKENQMGLVMLKIIEIIGEDDIKDLDPETIYFLNRILNELNLKKIRNNILSEVLPLKV